MDLLAKAFPNVRTKLRVPPQAGLFATMDHEIEPIYLTRVERVAVPVLILDERERAPSIEVRLVESALR
jgi:hypothetical protein